MPLIPAALILALAPLPSAKDRKPIPPPATTPHLCQAVLRFNYQVVPANREAMTAYENALGELLKQDLRPWR